MATFKATVLKNKIKQDGTYNVKIRVTHERKVSYVSTPYYVKKSDLTKDLELKSRDVLKVTDDIIDSYREGLLKLGNKVHLLNAQELADWLVKEAMIINIDFIAFSQGYIDDLIKNGKKGNAGNIQTALNALKDFLQRDKASIEDITSKMLYSFESYLLSERKIKREYKPGELIERTMPPVAGVFDYMRRIRQLFRAAQKEYNNRDTGDIKIKHYPFERYVIPNAPVAEKRNLEVYQIKAIRDLSDIPHNGKKTTNLCEFSRDIAMLSFYLVGINTVDLYNATEIKKGRLNYKRTKTKTRRKDEARISIKIEPEALPYFEKYKDPTGKRVFDFYKRYSSFRTFNKAVNIGLKQVAAELINKKIEITPNLEYYYFRGAWASIAKKDCRISTDDIGFALNHVIPEHETTNLYIETDFTIIDEANRKVLDALKPPNKLLYSSPKILKPNI